MTTKNFSGRAAPMDGASGVIDTVAPNDSMDLPGGITRAVYVGGAGVLAVIDTRGFEALIPSAAMQYHPIRVRRIKATGTTATGVLALY